MSLRVSDLERYERDGFLAFERLLDGDEVEAACAALREIMTNMVNGARSGTMKYTPPKSGETGNYDGAWIRMTGTRASMVFEHSFDPLSVGVDEALAHVRNLYCYEDVHPLFKQMVESPKIKGIAQELLGEEASLFQCMALVKPALVGSEKPWHQDNAYFKYAPLEKIVGFWAALDDADADNGCMHVLSGWHRRGGLRHIHTDDCKILPDRVRAQEAVAVELPAGGGMFFSGMLPHQTPPNRSPKPRRAIQFHYRGVSTRTVDQAEYDRLFAEPDGTPATCAAALTQTAPR